MKEHEIYAKAEECERDHEREYIKDHVISQHGDAVWRCVCEIEKWVGQKNWLALVADELAELLNGRFGKPGDTNGEGR